MTIFIASDHAGALVKETLTKALKAHGEQVEDLGTHCDTKRVHYPNYAIELARKITPSSMDLGILICGTGIGMSMVANRYQHLRAALCHSVEDAQMSKKHNNANVLCLGARTTRPEEIQSIVWAWLEARFEGGRHCERLALFETLGTPP